MIGFIFVGIPYFQRICGFFANIQQIYEILQIVMQRLLETLDYVC